MWVFALLQVLVTCVFCKNWYDDDDDDIENNSNNNNNNRNLIWGLK